MNPRRIDVGPLLALAGSLLLLVSLFLDWFEPGVTAWEVFEVLDLVLVAAAVIALIAALGTGAPVPALDGSWLVWAALLALLLVIAALLDHPPAARGTDPDTGLWLALGGSALMALGALLTLARVRISLDVQSRRRRETAADVRHAGDDATEPMPPSPESRL